MTWVLLSVDLSQADRRASHQRRQSQSGTGQERRGDVALLLEWTRCRIRLREGPALVSVLLRKSRELE
jgi:hypothetical protein